MRIQEIFAQDINRSINGVIKVDQDSADVIEQEVREYVITKELKKHFITFFNSYSDAFETPTDNIGVWISGFFGSGKSHFLKMLSYILENRSINGVSTVDLFREKFKEDPGSFLAIDKSTKGKTETILFNIDIEGSIKKDKTVVMRVFAKMFYSHLGFYGDNLKVVMLEQYIDQLGKTEEFRRVFESKKGKSWVSQRKAIAFNRQFVIPTLMEVLGISEEDAKRWFDDKTEEDFSIAQLVEDIKTYVNSKPNDFRLLFMIDEVGQYVGGDKDMLLNLQSLLEKIGSECMGKVWVVCTGQEAIDEIIKTRESEFSRIQARFKTRLSLSSSSVDEVIQKRILQKTPKAQNALEDLYNSIDSVLRNLFSFTDSVLDIKGYSGANEFAVDFPFVPYQFILIQKVFAEIRKHGNSGKHLSGGERSMLSGFQEAAQKIKDKDEYALAPFHLFYDTVHSFLDSSIRQVIERCERAANAGNGIEPQDVDVLKLLYLVRYVGDVKANLDNIVIMMADDIRLDKIAMREQVKASLERLLSQNYIGRSGDIYNFLTDEEQDIQREIKNTPVATAEVVGEIAKRIFADIYTTKKFRHGKYDFPFDQKVDGQNVGSPTGAMLLHILTMADDSAQKNASQLALESTGRAIVKLAEGSYYESMEKAMKIRKYVKQRNITQLPQSVQDIIRSQQNEAKTYEDDANSDLRNAIENADFYVDGERFTPGKADAKSTIDNVLECLVSRIYTELGLITTFIENDEGVYTILQSHILTDKEPNQDAADKVRKFLEMQSDKNLSTTMFDVQERYQKAPYGWREIDIAAVVAMLIRDQKVTIKYGGETIKPDNPKLPDMLRKKSEIGKTAISIRISVSMQNIRKVRDFLINYFNEMSVPEDEDGLVAYIIEKFDAEQKRYEILSNRYNNHTYPDQDKVKHAIELIKDVLSQQKDNTALIQRVIDRENALEDMREDLQDVEDFFKTRVALFDSAVKFVIELSVDQEVIAQDAEARQAFDSIQQIITIPTEGKFQYSRIPELNNLMTKARAWHNKKLEEKRSQLLEIARQCLEAIRTQAGDNEAAQRIFSEAENYYAQKRQQIENYHTLMLLNGLTQSLWDFKDGAVSRINNLLLPPAQTPTLDFKPKEENIKTVHRQMIFPAMELKTKEEIDDYVEKIRASMKALLEEYDGIKLV